MTRLTDGRSAGADSPGVGARVLIADDHPLIRLGLRAVLDGRSGMQVVGEARDGVEALSLAAERRPDVVVIDLLMPRLSGIEVARRLAAFRPRPQVLVLSELDSEVSVVEALRAGAAGYVLKSAPLTEVALAIEAVASGASHLQADIARRVAGSISDGGAPLLSDREREVLARVAEGLSSREIADELRLSPRTVEAHRARLMRKLGIQKSPGLVRFAIRAGLVAP